MDIQKDTQNSFSDLLENIKKELQIIIEDKSHEGKIPSETKTSKSESIADLEARLLKQRRVTPRDSQLAGGGDVLTDLSKSSLLEALPTNQLDEDIAKMKADLHRSYELFQKIGDKFETINFGSLKTRIKDLHVTKMNTAAGNATAEELEKIFKQKIFEKRLDQLTSEAGANFRKHPGEFGDIPELSQFFQACTQLEHGLEDIQRQRRESKNLGNRLMLASETSLDRITDIRRTLQKSYMK